jgi:catechol 2,3-dioxygenase-like lactoylglutathione lyase family enzyme
MFRHIGIVVKNLEKQLFFYKELIGLDVYYEETEKGIFLETLIGIKDVAPKIYKLGKNNQTIVELLYFPENLSEDKNNNLINIGITHFAITVEDLDKKYKLLKKNDVNFISEPIVSPNGKHKVCFSQDFESNYIELVQNL